MNGAYEAIVIGTSAGGLFALTTLLKELPKDYPIPIIITQHRSMDNRDLLEEVLQRKCHLTIKQADEKEVIMNGFAYLAPPGYHLLVETNRTFSLSSDDYVAYGRPSIDVLFETAAEAYTDKLVGVILTGANSDGAAGIKAIKMAGGLTIAQDPKEALYPMMPQSAISKEAVDQIWTLYEIHQFMLGLSNHAEPKTL